MYMKKIKLTLLSFLLFATCYMLHATAPLAQADFGLAIYPPILQIQATAPTSVRTQVSIQNTGSDPVILSIKLRAFKPSSDNNGTIEFLKDSDGIPGNDPLIFQRIEILDDSDKPINQTILGPSQE